MKKIFLLLVLLLTVKFIFSQVKTQNKTDMKNTHFAISTNLPNRFPYLKAKTLAGRKVNFPEEVKGRKAFIVLAFEKNGEYKNSQYQADKWSEFYANHLQEKGILFYEIPMMSKKYTWVSFWVDAGMRSGIPKEKHDKVACFYGDKMLYARLLGIEDLSQAYAFLLDENGKILWKALGVPNHTWYQSIESILQ